MNVLLMTIGAFRDVSDHGAYTDLLRFFQEKGHSVYVVCAREKRQGLSTCIEEQDGIQILRVRIGNITKVRFLEKGISTLLIKRQYEQAIKKYFGKLAFDIVLYSTPPITLAGVVGTLKKKKGSFTYLMLKDIFPAGAKDLGVLPDAGVKGLIYRYFRSVEKKLYKNSDGIGCMSPANQSYLLKHNPQISEEKVGICPNTIDIMEKTPVDKKEICKKFMLPENKLLLLYGGNFGLPQHVDYIIEVLQCTQGMQEIHFVMCGSGTEFYKVKQYGKENAAKNITVIDTLPYSEYQQLLSVCDVGMLFLDYRFQVPNFPSRLLDYMNYELPVAAATDRNTDVGQAILEGGFGWWCESRGSLDFLSMIESIAAEWKQDKDQFLCRGKRAKQYLIKSFRTEIAYTEIIETYENWKAAGGRSR